MRKSPVREASCELEADAHVLSLLIDYKNRSETAADQFEKAKKRRRHLVPESTVPSLDMLWEEEKLRRGKVKNSSSSSTTPLMQSEAAISPMTNAPADEAMRNVSIGNGFITCPKLLRSNKKGTVLHRYDDVMIRLGNILVSNPPLSVSRSNLCVDRHPPPNATIIQLTQNGAKPLSYGRKV